MGKRVKVALVVLAVALVGVIGWQVGQPPAEPVYEGRKLTSWLEHYYPRSLLIASLATNPADEAVRQIGTNAIPTLLRLLRAKDSTLKVKLMGLLQRQHLINVRYTPSPDLNYAAALAFRMLGESARSAVPDLIEIADDTTSPFSRTCVIMSLGFIGPPAREAVPELLLLTTNPDPDVRSWARRSLLRIDPEAASKAGITNTP